MAATMRDIAQSLKLSTSTVSYALNGGPRSVSDDVRKKVFAAAEELGYHPNRVARSLATGRAHAVGVVLPEIADDGFLGPYLIFAFNGLTKEAARSHQDVVIFTSLPEASPKELGAKILDGRVDGVIFVTPYLETKTVELAASLHLPCTAISGAAIKGVCSFSTDNADGMERALRHLYDLGHRRIAHIAGRLDLQDAAIRLEAYKRFLRRHNLPLKEEWIVEGRFSNEGGRRAMRALMSLPVRPTAIACANDEMAIGAVLEASRLKVRVPEDLSITGFDMSPASGLVLPAVTTVRQPIEEMGRAAVQALLSLIDGENPPQENILATELIVRDSTSHPTKDIP